MAGPHKSLPLGTRVPAPPPAGLIIVALRAKLQGLPLPVAAPLDAQTAPGVAVSRFRLGELAPSRH